MSPRLLLPALASSLVAFPFSLAPSAKADFPTPTNNQEITNIPLTPPEKTIGMMHLPPGFKATLFAAEPDVQQPIAMCWDEKGRLWIAENYTYSDGKERFDMKLKDRILIFEDADNDGHFDKRTVFHDDLQMLTSIARGFGGVYALCPPHLLWIPTKDDKPSGPPQILLDGFSTTAASRHTFANGLKWGPDGWLYGRVGISSTSWIDVPGTPEAKRKPTAGGIWRYHPTRKIYEPYCHGTTNPWGMDWDEHGEMFFVNTVIGHLWHGIHGAHFKRMHGEDPYDHIYGLIDQHADHYHWDTGKKWSETRDAKGLTDTLGGGHVHIGLMIYQGTNWPKEYRGKLFTCNQHGHRINCDRVEREGSGYVGKHEPDFMKSDDPWLRAIEIQQGPDGGVYVLDWCDIGECHEADGAHRTSGRIYKITYGDPVKPKETDLTKLTDEELVKLQLSDNEWLVRMARWELRERAWISKRQDPKPIANETKVSGPRGINRPNVEGANSNRSALQLIYDLRLEQADPTTPMARFKVSLPLDFLETYLMQVQFTDSLFIDRPFTVEPIPKDRDLPDYYLAMLTRRSFLDRSLTSIQSSFEPSSRNTQMIWQITREEKSPLVRLAWASALQRLPTMACLNSARGLLSHAEDATDHNLPLMYWFGIRDLPPAELVKLVKDCRIQLVTQFIARRITEDIDKDPAPLNELLTFLTRSGGATAPTSQRRGAEATPLLDPMATDILRGMTDALKGWRKAKKPAEWEAFESTTRSRIRENAGRIDAQTTKDGPSRVVTNAATTSHVDAAAMLRDLNVLFGDGRALEEVRAIALDDKADVEARRSALRTLIEAKSPDTRKICEKLLTERSLAVDATQGLATFDDPAIAETIVKRWRNFYANEHGAVVAALASRPSFARVLLAHIGEGGIQHGDITPVIARQIRSFNDPALTRQLTETWGEIRESSDDKKKLIAALKAKLTPEFVAKGDPSQGRFLYAGICAACHKLYGEGNTIGPDLTGSGRHEINYLIENIADPSAVVAADFTMAVVTLKDGRVLNGVIGAKTDRTITVKMVGMETTVDKNDIAKQEQLPVSIMPEGQLQALSDKQLSDLFAYLMGSSQVPLPQTAAK